MIVFLSLFLLFPLSTSAHVDSCDIIDEDYCFYFGESNCYQKICDCAISKCEGNCTLPFWCSKEGGFNVTDDSLTQVSLDCSSLKNSCVSQKYFNGYCFFYKKRCPSDSEVDRKSKDHFVITDNCVKWQSTCEKKWKKHHACRQFKKHCKHLMKNRENNGTDVVGFANSTEVFHPSTGPNWERNMKRRCRDWRKKCKKDPNSSACGRVAARCEKFGSHGEDPVVGILNSTDSTTM